MQAPRMRALWSTPSLHRLGAVLGLATIILLSTLGFVVTLPGGAANASVTPSHSVPTGTTLSTSSGTAASPAPSFICSSGGTAPSASADNYLPINRWADATSNQHTRLSLNLFNIGNLPDVVQRDFVVADAQALGNTFWKAGVGLTEAATRFCFANSVASTADGLTATIGRALSSGGLVALLLVAATILILVRLRRGDGTARHQVGKIVVVLLIFAVMVNGAEQTKTGANGQVSFGFGSPGWVLTHVYNAVSMVASAPAAALSGVADSLSFNGTTGQKIDAEDPLSCGNYVSNLRSDYRAAYGPSASSNMAATVPLALDSMWEQSGLTTYAYSQFGANNDYAPLVYCRLLEANANIPPATQVAITDQTPRAAAILAGTVDSGGGNTAMAWASDQNLGNSPDDTTDESMIGWAACQTNSTDFTPMEWSTKTGDPVTSEWTQVVDPNAQGSSYGASGTVTPQLCRAFFDHSFNGLAPQQTALEWPDNPGQISTAAAGPGGPFNGFADYVNNLHGTSNGSAEMLSIMFLISSTVDLLVFGLMAGAVLVAKFSLLFLMAFAALFLLVSLWPGAAASSRLAGLAKHAFSMVLFVTGAQVILSIVAITTSIIMDTGTAVAGAGSFLALLWMGIAPIAAIFIVHHLFKQVLKAPSPFKLSSALAWGSAAGGIGAGVTAGLDRIANRQAVWGTTKRALSAARSPFDTARLMRKHTMDPMGAGSQTELVEAGSAGALRSGDTPGTRTGEATQNVQVGGSKITKEPSRLVAGQSVPSAARNRPGSEVPDRTAGAPAIVRAPTLPTPDDASRATDAQSVFSTAASTPNQRVDAGMVDSEYPEVSDSPAGADPAGATSTGTGRDDAGLAQGAASTGIGTGTLSLRSLLHQRVAQRGEERSAEDSKKSDPQQLYKAAVAYAARRGRLQVGADGLLRNRTGRVIGAPLRSSSVGAAETDSRSIAEKLRDDRALRKVAVRAGRHLNRQALSNRAATNALNRFAARHQSSGLAKVAGALGKPTSIRGQTIQRVAERTRRAAAEFRARPVRRQLAAVTKVGALGIAGLALMASPPALGVAAGAYALRRAHKSRFGLDAVQANNQRHIAAFKEAAAAQRARRQDASMTDAPEQAQQEHGDGQSPAQEGEQLVEKAPSSEQPPLRDAPEDIDDVSSEWTPPSTEPEQVADARPAQAHDSKSPAGQPMRAVPAHKPPKSKAVVLSEEVPPRVPDQAERARPTRNEDRIPSHLVGNRRANQPAEQDEIPPEVRARFDEADLARQFDDERED